MGQTSTSMKASQSQEDHEHDPTRTSQVLFTKADLTDSMRSPGRNLHSTHLSQTRGKAARLRSTGRHTDKSSKQSQESGAWDQGEQPTKKMSSRIATQDARITSDLYSTLSQNIDTSQSPASSLPVSSPASSSSGSQISDPSVRKKKKHRRKKKVPVTDPNHGKESSQTTVKIKPSSTSVAASMALFTQEWASSICANEETDDSRSEDRTSGAQATTPASQPRQEEQSSAQSDRSMKSSSGSAARERKDMQGSATVSSQLDDHVTSSDSQIEPGQRFPEYLSSDPLETHTQPWDDFHDFPMSYYGVPSPPDLPSRIHSVELHGKFQSSDSSYQPQRPLEFNESRTQSTSLTVSTVQLSPASTLDARSFESQRLDVAEHVISTPFGEEQGNQSHDIILSSTSLVKKETLSRQVKPAHCIVASSQGSDPVAKAPSQSLRPSSTGTTTQNPIPPTKLNGSLTPTQLPSNRILSTQSQAEEGSKGSMDQSSMTQLESDSGSNSEGLTPSVWKRTRATQRRITLSDNSGLEIGGDEAHSPGPTKSTTQRMSMSPRRSTSGIAARAASAQESKLSDSSPMTKSSESDMSPSTRLRRRYKESDYSTFHRSESEYDEHSLSKQHKSKMTISQPTKLRISRSESDSEILMSDSGHSSDENSSLVSTIQHKDSNVPSNKPSPSRDSQDRVRYVLESVLIPSVNNWTDNDTSSARSAVTLPTLTETTARKALKGRYFLEAIAIPVHNVVKKTQPLQGLQEIHPESEQSGEEPSRKRTKITMDSIPPTQRNESDSMKQILESDEIELEIEDGTERLTWDHQKESLAGSQHSHGRPDPDQQTITLDGERLAVSEGREKRSSIPDEPGWTDLIELWKKHDFQWALQRNRTKPSRVWPYSPGVVFGTTVLNRR